MQCVSQTTPVSYSCFLHIQTCTYQNTGSQDDRQQPPHHITILPLPRLLLLWQPGHHVQPSRGRKQENGNTHSEAGAFLLRGVPIMAASSLPSPLSQCLLLSCVPLWFPGLLHLLEEREIECPSWRIRQALGGSERWASPPTRLQQEREKVK